MHDYISKKRRKNSKIKFDQIKLICSLAWIINFLELISVKVCILRSKKCIAHRKTKRRERGDCQMTWSEFAVSLFMAVIVAAIQCEIAWTYNSAYKAHMSISYCIYFFVISLYYLYVFYNFLLITRNKNFKLCFSDTA